MKLTVTNGLLILLILAIIGGFVGLGIYLYRKSLNVTIRTSVVDVDPLNKEKFGDCVCDGSAARFDAYKTIISVPTGVSYPIEYSTTDSNATDTYYSVKYYNQKTGTYAYLMVGPATEEGGSPILTVGANNINDDGSQLWKIVKLPSNTPTVGGTTTTPAAGVTTTTTTTTTPNRNTDKYYLVSKNYPAYALQYENGYLNIRAKGEYDHQYWILDTAEYDKGIESIANEYVNAPPAARNVSNARAGSGTNDINSVNQQKLENVLQLITSSLQQLNTANSNNSASAFGYSTENPIKINLTMGGGVSASNTEAFTDVNNDVTSLLDKYENSNSNNSNSIDALTELIANNGGCQALDMSKYTSKRVGQCNCNLSK
jgi:hypothetical protein